MGASCLSPRFCAFCLLKVNELNAILRQLRWNAILFSLCHSRLTATPHPESAE